MNLGSVARAIWRNKRSIIGPTLLLAAAAFIGVNLITPRYNPRHAFSSKAAKISSCGRRPTRP
jgi:hypothetical protein